MSNGANHTSVQAAEIIRHYRRNRGLSGVELTRAVGRHARLLGPLDPVVAEELEISPLGIDALKLWQAEAMRRAYRRRVGLEKRKR